MGTRVPTTDLKLLRKRQLARESMRRLRARRRGNSPPPPTSREHVRCPCCGKVSRGQNFGAGAAGKHVLEMLLQRYVDGTFVWERLPLRLDVAGQLRAALRSAYDRVSYFISDARLLDSLDAFERSFVQMFDTQTILLPERSVVSRAEQDPVSRPDRQPTRIVVRSQEAAA